MHTSSTYTILQLKSIPGSIVKKNSFFIYISLFVLSALLHVELLSYYLLVGGRITRHLTYSYNHHCLVYKYGVSTTCHYPTANLPTGDTLSSPQVEDRLKTVPYPILGGG